MVRKVDPRSFLVVDDEEPTKPRGSKPLAPTPAAPVDERAVAILLASGPMTCQRLGERLWGPHAPGGHGRPGSAPFARAAGRVLHRLERAGRVCRRNDGHHTLWSVILKNGRPLAIAVAPAPLAPPAAIPRPAHRFLVALRHRPNRFLVGVAPDSVHCTYGSRAEARVFSLDELRREVLPGAYDRVYFIELQGDVGVEVQIQ